ncbi:hypothetical protein D3C84_1178250 [compost metagenome]
MYTVPSTDRLSQPAVLVNQGNCHAIDLGLHPDLHTITQPVFDGASIAEFFQAGMGYGMGNPAGGGT